jgi:ABC-3C protein
MARNSGLLAVKYMAKKSANKRSAAAPVERTPQVPDQYWGYSLQAIRFLQLLLERPAGTVVTLEVFEDVGASHASGEIASQVKSGLVKNPLTDRAVDLWKTLRNWTDATTLGRIAPRSTVFEIYVAKPRNGRIASTFHKASSEGEAKAAIRDAKRVLLGDKSRKPQLPSELANHVNRVFSADLDALAQIVCNFRITAAQRDPISDLRPIVEAKWVRPECVDLVIQHAHGWLKERLDSLLQLRQLAAVSVDDFNEEMRKFIPRCDFLHFVADMAGRPTLAQVAAERVRTYVRQLELIEFQDEDTLESINSYLRACVMRTKLSERGLVHEDSFEEYEEALLTFWRNKKRQRTLTNPTEAGAQMGQLLLTDCCLHGQKLQGLEMPSYFTPGSYHALADVESVGWHPDYKKLLRGHQK